MESLNKKLDAIRKIDYSTTDQNQSSQDIAEYNAVAIKNDAYIRFFVASIREQVLAQTPGLQDFHPCLSFEVISVLPALDGDEWRKLTQQVLDESQTITSLLDQGAGETIDWGDTQPTMH